MKLDSFTQAFFIAALWSTNDGADEQGGEPLDANYEISDIDPTCLEKLTAECERFQSEQADHITSQNCVYHHYNYLEHAGHDFWLTRCGHGCGFWDGDWTEPAATKLTAASKAFGNVDLYVGDDGKIYAMGYES